MAGSDILLQRFNVGQSSFPSHDIGTQVRLEDNRVATFVEFGEAVARGDLVQGAMPFQATSGLSGTANEQTFGDTAAGYTVEVRDANRIVTTKMNPRLWSLLHVYAGTGDQQFARVEGVIDTSTLAVHVLTDADGEWSTTLASASARIYTPGLAYKADLDTALRGHLSPIGVAQRAFSSGDFGYVLSDGLGIAKLTAGAVNGSVVGLGKTAGQLSPLALYGSATYDPASINTGAGLRTTLTVTGAAVGDFALVTHSTIGTNAITITGAVTAANTVSVEFINVSGSAIDLTSGTLSAMVIPQWRYQSAEIGTVLSVASSAGELSLVNMKCYGGGNGPILI